LETNSLSPQRAEEIKPEGFSPLFEKVQTIYIRQFWEWFAITAPTSVVAAIILALADWKVRTIYLSHSRFEVSQPTTLAETLGLRFGSYFFAWFLGCFALAAIATVVGRLDGEQEDAPLRDRHQRAREHLGAIFNTAIATLIAMLIGMAILEIVMLTALKVAGPRHFSRYIYAVTQIGTLIVAGIVSRLGMAVPLVVRGDIGVWAALNESLKIGERHKGLLYLLLIQSVVGSYVGWYAVHFALMLVPEWVKPSAWYGWGVLIVSTLAGAAVSPPLFIGFAVLAEEYSPKRDGDQPELAFTELKR
jgi:hypothetical protein